MYNILFIVHFYVFLIFNFFVHQNYYFFTASEINYLVLKILSKKGNGTIQIYDKKYNGAIQV